MLQEAGRQHRMQRQEGLRQNNCDLKNVILKRQVVTNISIQEVLSYTKMLLGWILIKSNCIKNCYYQTMQKNEK